LKTTKFTASLSVTPEWRQSIFLGYIPEAQSIRVLSSQDDIHTLLVSSFVAISLPTPSKF
jgi:hypothetical protein